jgi:glycosyltransferase involved in cell wall biosynthesis
MIQLSAVIITYNEERNIERCLLSLQGIMDEILILDSFSTDQTKAIALKFDIQFHEKAWAGYAQSKNYANQLARYDYVFSIDADECLSPELQAAILAYKNSGIVGIAELNRLTNYCGKWIKHCGWYPDRKIRLFDRRKVQWEGDIHETLTVKGEPKPYFLKGDLWHYSYYTKADHFAQIEKFTTIAAGSEFNKGKRSNLGQAYLSAFVKFVQAYFFRLGLLDGWAGFLVCKRSAYASYLKYYKILQLQGAR